MIRASYATKKIIELYPDRSKNIPLCTTAYFLFGEKCSGGCDFCIQSNKVKYRKDKINFLSRITWPAMNMDGIEIGKRIANIDEFVRICFQMTKTVKKETWNEIFTIIKYASKPVSFSYWPSSLEDAINVLAIDNVDILNISIDVCNPLLFESIKGEEWKKFWNFLLILNKKFNGSIRTHLIVGLGESDMDIVKLMFRLYELKIGWGLFAFYPLKGTPMQDFIRPDRKRYYLLKIVEYLILNNKINYKDIEFDNKGMIFKINVDNLINLIDSGKPFLTSGCPGCNRPYYNETPLELPYNFLKLPNYLEIEKIKEILKFTSAN